jgi:hypothetical protein
MATLPLEACEPVQSGAGLESRGGLSRPLVVDVDRVLQHGDLTIDVVISELSRRPQAAFALFAALLCGPAAFKRQVAQTRA